MAEGESRRSASGISAPVWLTALLLAMLIPFIAFAAYSVGELNQNQRLSDEQRIIERVDSLSANVDREIRGMISLANALAASSYLRDGRLREFQSYAEITRPTPTTHVILFDDMFRQIVNTRRPYGTPLPGSPAPGALMTALSTGKPFVSNIVLGLVAKRRVFDVIVPVEFEGHRPYALVVTDEPERITNVLAEQALRSGWHSAVLDGIGNVIAADGAIGAGSRFPLETLNGRGRIETTIAGHNAVLHRLKSDLTGWTSMVWVPIDTLNAPTDALWKSLIAASLIALLASAALAYLFARPFAWLMRDTMRNISLMGTVADMPPIRSLLDEGGIISSRLDEVNHQLLARQRENEEGSALLLALLENVPEGITIAGGPDLKIIANSRQALEWLGHDKDAPSTSPSLKASDLPLKLPDGSVPDAEKMPLVRASRHGESLKGLQLTLERADGGRMPIEMSVNPFRDGSGKIIGAVSTWRDITERKQAEQTLRLISRELTHRAKNLLTVILGIAKQTAREGMTIEEFLSVFSQRIQGLGASQDLLTRSDWSGAYLEELVTSQLAPFGGVDGVRIKINGPQVLLKNDILQTLGLALHELGTNAVKYGALSAEKGTVDVKWDIVRGPGGPRLKMVWKERGGPPVRKPTRKGFGHNITVRSLARVISGEVKLDFAKSGIVWALDAPLSALSLETDRPIVGSSQAATS